MFLFILEVLSIPDLIGIAVLLGVIFYAVKSQLKKESENTSKSLTEGQKNLLELKAEELTLKTVECDRQALEIKELKEENRLLHREISQRIEIHKEDTDELRELRKLKNG